LTGSNGLAYFVALPGAKGKTFNGLDTRRINMKKNMKEKRGDTSMTVTASG
jgi:hypothetical protein